MLHSIGVELSCQEGVAKVCGVVGFWNRDGRPADPAVLSRMLDRSHHRGPDDRGSWVREAIALGLTRLSILDLSIHGHQPFETAAGDGVISYNGEVYNYRDLRRELEHEGVQFKSGTDTEVVLQALHRWGPEAAIPRLNGMFALAYHDRRTATLWLTRDRSGIKPLYTAANGATLVFASEAKALFAHPGIPCRADLHTLTTLAIHGRLTGDWTPFEGVTTVMPGTMVRITAADTTVLTYFDLMRDVDVDRIVAGQTVPFADQVKTFDQHFTHSVEMHLLSDAPLAMMCSGGLDSSLIAAVAKERQPDIEAYVAEVEGMVVHEADKAVRVCDHLGVRLHRVKISRSEYLRRLPLAVLHNDQPNFFAQDPLKYCVAQAASDDGFKVLLTGEGSDELFGGYRWYVYVWKMWRARRWQAALVPNIGPLRRLGRYLNNLAPLDMAALMSQPFSPRFPREFGRDEVQATMAIDAGQRHFRAKALFDALAQITPLEDRAFLAREFEDFYSHLPTLLAANDKMTMAASVEARVPFLENALIDFGIHLPLSAKFARRQTKRVVKAAADARLPRDIVHATKIGFGVPLDYWASALPLLRNGAAAELFKWSLEGTEQIQAMLAERKGLLFRVLAIEIWARLYLKGETVEDLGERLQEYA